MEYKRLLENNRVWVQKKLAQDKDFFEKLSKGQTPKHLFIGCSDSRVTAEELLGADAGEVFVHRNIANLVPNNDNIQPR